MKRNQIHMLRCLSAVLCCLMFLVPQTAHAATYGTCEELLRGCDPMLHNNTEISLGSITADAAAEYGGAEIALLPSEDFGNNILPGEVTDEVLADCFRNDSELAATTMTSSQLYELLEIGFSHVVLTEDHSIDWDASYFAGYLQISGLKVTYDAAAPAGQRVTELTLADGTPVDQEDETTTHRVVSTKKLLLGAYGYPPFPEEALEEVGGEREVLAAYFQARGTVSPPQDSRVTIKGTRDWLVGNKLTLILLIAAVCVIVSQLAKSKKREKEWRNSRTATAEEIRQDSDRQD